MWARIHLVAVAILLAGPARAASIGMHWNDCLSAGARDLQATCDANDGRSVLVGWFDPPAGITALIGEEVVVDLCAMTADLPSWWQMGAGECRAGAFYGTSNFVGTGLETCEDYWGGGTFDLVRYLSRYHDSNDARLVLTAGFTSGSGGAVTPGHNYYAFRFGIANAKTVGPDACSGCDTPVCIFFNSLRLDQPPGVGDIYLFTGQLYATWRGGRIECLVPAHRGTWGQLKSLYR